MYTLADLIIAKQHEQVKQALRQGADVNEFDQYGFTPLIEAGITNDLEMTKILLQAGADPNLQDLTGGTVLHWAVENNNLELCSLLLENGASANQYSRSSEPPLVKAILRRQRPLQQLLLKYQANKELANDFIFTKLLAHRYELRGHVDIVDDAGEFTEVNLEGFFLESTLGLVMNSLHAYINNYAAKQLTPYFDDLKTIAEALDRASQLQCYLQYQKDRQPHQQEIKRILMQPLLILPIGCAGHATTILIKDNWLALCDRRKEDSHMQGIVIYKIENMSMLSSSMLYDLVFTKKDADFFNKDLVPTLKLRLVKRIMIEPQMTGNCSWANVEASIPAALFLLREAPFADTPRIIDYQHPLVQIFRHWREWDKKRALHFMLHDFPRLSQAQRASRAALLSALVFQRCHHSHPEDLRTAKRIIRLLKEYNVDHCLQTYLTTYYKQNNTESGKQFYELLQSIEDDLDD
jgi:hypothetical protein